MEQYDVIGMADEREQWLALRKTGIGASEIAAVLGESPWVSALQLYAEKTGQVETADLADEVESVFWGTKLEPVIIEVYGQRTGRTVQRAGKLLRSHAEPWALATLDALTDDDSGAAWPLEVKTASAFVAEEWAEGPPPHYYLQVQQQLLVTGAARATVACLLGGQRLVWCDVDRDDVAIRRLVYAGRRFWGRVQNADAPAPDGSDSAKRTLAQLYPHDDPEKYVVLPADLQEVADELEDLKEQTKAAKRRQTELENLIKAALGTGTRGVLPSGIEYSWKEQTTKEHVVKESSFRVLRRHAPKKGR